MRAIYSLLTILAYGASAALFGNNTSSYSAWTPVATTERKPPPSMSHVVGLLDDSRMIVFGGCTSSCCFAPLDATWELVLSKDGASGEWTELQPILRPSARFGMASAVAEGREMYVFGGQDSSQSFLGELWRFSGGVWEVVTPEGEGPSPRAAHSMSIVDGHLVVYGGFGPQGALSDVVVLDLRAEGAAWRLLVTDGAPQRWHHAAVPGDGKVTIFGGVDGEGVDRAEAFVAYLDLEEGTAVFKPVETTTPQPQARHAAVVVYPVGGQFAQSFTVVGGINTTTNTLPSSVLEDAAVFSVERQAWTLVDRAEVRITKRAYASVAQGREYSVVVGGFAGYTGDTDDRLLNDAWVFRHSAVQEASELAVAEQ